MTYLDLVNNVLRRIREDEVSAVSESSYSKLVGDFVNDAKRQVEDAWDWSALRTTLSVNTSSGTFNYVLTGSQNRVKVLDVLNDTSNRFMQYNTQHWFNEQYLGNDTVVSGSPNYYTFNGVNANGDTQVDIFPKPDGVYALRFNVVQRGADLSADSDQTQVPAQPIINLAVAFAARERGETGGPTAAEYFSIANNSLSDAIALDAQKHPEEVVWYTV